MSRSFLTPNELNVLLLKAFGIELSNDAGAIQHVTLELRPRDFPLLVVKRGLVQRGGVVEQIEALKLQAGAEEEGRAPVSAPAAAASMSTSGEG
jgi:hypothetical protein